MIRYKSYKHNKTFALLFIFLISLLFTALGTAIASLMEDFHGFQLIINFLIMPLFFLSGALFPLDGLPKALKIITSINPLSWPCKRPAHHNNCPQWIWSPVQLHSLISLWREMRPVWASTIRFPV